MPASNHPDEAAHCLALSAHDTPRTFLRMAIGTEASAGTSVGRQSLRQSTGPLGARRAGSLVKLIGLLWLVVLGAGFYGLAREEFTPAAAAVPILTFPPRSALALASDRPTLMIFVHPHCPCTRASLREFDILLASLSHRVEAMVVFTVPKGVPPHWEQGELWRTAASMPGVRAFIDQDGREAERFGVKSSGHVLLFQRSGRLIFSGGITPSRGHEGDNPGRSAVVGLVLDGRAAASRTPVFGCPLLGPPASASL